MNSKDKLDLNNPNFLDFIVDYRTPLVILVVVISVFFAYMAPSLPTDPTLRSGLDQTSESYQNFRKFAEEFGDEEFILVSLYNEIGVKNPAFLNSLAQITDQIQKLDGISETLSLSNLKMFREVDGKFGSFPIISESPGGPVMPDKSTLENMKTALPIIELMISQTERAFGLLVKMDEKWKFDTHKARQISREIKQICAKYAPTGTDCRVVGSAIIRQAIVKYNIQTGIIFGALCMLIGTLVSIYVFKSIKLTLITNLILGVCVLWVLGLMAVLKIPLNSTTALSFGFIPITTVEIVIHMVVRYSQYFLETNDKVGAIKKSVRYLARPCLICSSTTAVGFGALMVSSIPMVKQLGFIMSFGIIISYSLAMVLTPAFFMRLNSLDAPRKSGITGDYLSGILDGILAFIFRRHRLIVGFGIVLTIILFSGTPFIKNDSQILRMLSYNSPESQDLAFVEEKLNGINSLDLVIESEPNAFKKASMWAKVEELDTELKKLPEVVAVESFLPLLKYVDQTGSDQKRKDYFADPSLLPQLLMIMTLSPDGARITERHLNSDYSRLHIPIRIKNSPDVPISRTIKDIRQISKRVMDGHAKTVLTGELTVVSDQTTELIRDQIKSMIIAAILITILMMIQMQSVYLGFLCLIPNIPPVAAVFGIMGWFGIALDGITVFAATVAIGLAVDNTIHFLTQLKRDIALKPGLSINQYVAGAYKLTARQIASWNIVIMLGFLALSISPFRPVVFFGILGCSSLALGLFGDLLFVQSLIISSSRIKNTIKRLVERESGLGSKGNEVVEPVRRIAK